MVLTGKSCRDSIQLIISLSSAAVAITCCESTFEWSCSAPVNGVAFFPDISTDVSDPVIGIGKTTSTSVETIYIYPVPQDAQRCSGTVTGVQYCYRAGRSVNFNLFNFDDPVNSTRNTDRTEFSISQVISITNNGSMCSESVCCASATFSGDTQFQLETDVFTYGIRVVLSSILGFVERLSDFKCTCIQYTLLYCRLYLVMEVLYACRFYSCTDSVAPV